MRLTKYQKSRLLEFEWNLVQDEQQENTCWARLSKQDGDVFDRLKRLLKLDKNINEFKILIVATQ